MPTVAVYRCPKCGTEYRPLDAGARRYLCCGVSLERVSICGATVTRTGLAAFAAVLETNAKKRNDAQRAEQAKAEVVEIIPPRENIVDALAVETLLQTLAAETPFSLEIAGDMNGRRFLLRAARETLVYLRRQIQARYDQATFRDIPPGQDPACSDKRVLATAQMTLRRPVYLPLRTYSDGDFREADPIAGLLGAFSNLDEGERVLSQIVLFPAPSTWADRYQGSTRQIEKSFGGEAMTIGMLVRQFVSVIAVMVALGFFVWGLLAFLQHHWLEFFLAGTLAAFSTFGVIALAKLLMEQSNINPEMVQRKIATPAYDSSLRLIAMAKTAERAAARLRQLAMAYRQFNLASGNAFVVQRAEFDPQILFVPRWNWWQEFTGHITRLNSAELASLWHLPVGPGVQLIERTQAKRLLPLPASVGKGILIGHAQHQGQDIPVHLDTESLFHHIFMVAKTQKGKSTLMAHLAAAAMDKDTALVVIDPHGDLVRSLVSLVPRSRLSDVLFIDFSDSQRVVGLNLLDMAQGRNADAIVSNIVHVGELIWSDYWGPRMEDALRMALRTLLMANEILARRRDKQFTLIDIPPLFELPNFRHRLLKQYVSDPEILQWWSGYFEQLYPHLRMDVINPVLTKIHRFSTHTAVRNIVAQSNSTVNFRELLNERRILLVNTATGVMGPDAGGLLGAVLVDYINFAVREQMAIPDPSSRARVIVVVDEFQSIPGVDYPSLLAELQKMGASFILATQALGQLDAISRVLRPTILSNIETLLVFQTSADDADILRHELDEEVTSTDIINLSDHSCYVKTQVGRDRLPVMHIDTLPPQRGDQSVAEQIIAQMERYARPVKVVEWERRTFQSQWYGRELELLRQALALEGQKAPKESKAKSADSAQPQSKTKTQEPKSPDAIVAETSITPTAESISSDGSIAASDTAPANKTAGEQDVQPAEPSMPPNANLDLVKQPPQEHRQVTDDKKTRRDVARSNSDEAAAPIQESKRDHPGDDEDSARDVDEKAVKP